MKNSTVMVLKCDRGRKHVFTLRDGIVISVFKKPSKNYLNIERLVYKRFHHFGTNKNIETIVKSETGFRLYHFSVSFPHLDFEEFVRDSGGNATYEELEFLDICM